MITITIAHDSVTPFLLRLRERLANMSPVMRQISGIMHSAVEDNFAARGRPRWKPSIRARKEGGKTLQDTGILAGSIKPKWSRDQAIVGTKIEYAAIHQFGGRTPARVIYPRKKKALKTPFGLFKKVNHPGCVMPARPFLSLVDNDWKEIYDKIDGYLVGGRK